MAVVVDRENVSAVLVNTRHLNLSLELWVAKWVDVGAFQKVVGHFDVVRSRCLVDQSPGNELVTDAVVLVLWLVEEYPTTQLLS